MADMAPSFEGMVFSVGLWGENHVENINNYWQNISKVAGGLIRVG